MQIYIRARARARAHTHTHTNAQTDNLDGQLRDPLLPATAAACPPRRRSSSQEGAPAPPGGTDSGQMDSLQMNSGQMVHVELTRVMPPNVAVSPPATALAGLGILIEERELPEEDNQQVHLIKKIAEGGSAHASGQV